MKKEDKEEGIMERLTKGEAVFIENDKEYIIIDIVEKEDQRFLYMLNKEEVEIMIVKEIIEDGEIILETLDNQEDIIEIVEKVTRSIRR